MTAQAFHDRPSLPDLVANMKITWMQENDNYPEVLRKSGLVREINIPANSGDTRDFSELDSESFARIKGEGAKAKKLATVQGHSKTGKMYRIGGERDITWELMEYNKYPELMEKIKDLGKTGKNRLALDLAHRIGFGTETSYVNLDGMTVDLTTGDGKALFATDHSLTASTDTCRNILSGNAPFSKSALQDMLEMRRQNKKDNFGVNMQSMDDIIFSTADESTVEAIEELLRSTGSTDVDKNSGVFNRYNGRMKHVVIPYLDTDANGVLDTAKELYWGVADSSHPDIVLGMGREPYLKTSLDGTTINEDFSTDTIQLGVRGDWMIVTPGSKGIALSKGDGTA